MEQVGGALGWGPRLVKACGEGEPLVQLEAPGGHMTRERSHMTRESGHKYTKAEAVCELQLCCLRLVVCQEGRGSGRCQQQQEVEWEEEAHLENKNNKVGINWVAGWLTQTSCKY